MNKNTKISITIFVLLFQMTALGYVYAQEEPVERNMYADDDQEVTMMPFLAPNEEDVSELEYVEIQPVLLSEEEDGMMYTQDFEDLSDEDMSAYSGLAEEVEEENLNFFQRILKSIRDFFSNLFDRN